MRILAGEMRILAGLISGVTGQAVTRMHHLLHMEKWASCVLLCVFQASVNNPIKPCQKTYKSK